MSHILTKICINSILYYQRWISPLFIPRCRFFPSCSSYALECLEQKGFFFAIFKISKRVLKCNPLNHGGVDLP